MRLERCLRILLYAYKPSYPGIAGKSIKSFSPFSTSCRRPTDGVYRALTEMRVKTPWIEALRKKQAEGFDPKKASATSATPQDRDLSPKRMGDSHTAIVCNTCWCILEASLRLTD